jgi:hypothetical protein
VIEGSTSDDCSGYRVEYSNEYSDEYSRTMVSIVSSAALSTLNNSIVVSA